MATTIKCINTKRQRDPGEKYKLALVCWEERYVPHGSTNISTMRLRQVMVVENAKQVRDYIKKVARYARYPMSGTRIDYLWKYLEGFDTVAPRVLHLCNYSHIIPDGVRWDQPS